MIADAFYEPVRFKPTKNKMLIIAAIYSNWQEQQTCTMITTTANDVVQPFKDRMPVLLLVNTIEFGLYIYSSSQLIIGNSENTSSNVGCGRTSFLTSSII